MVNSNVLADYDRLREIALSEYSGNPDDDSLTGCVSQITCGGFFNQKIVDSYPASALRYPDIFQTFLFHLGLLTVTGSRAG